MLLVAARFASNTVSRLASADMGSVTIWDIDMKERSDDKLTEQFVLKIDSNAADGEGAQDNSTPCVTGCSPSLCLQVLPSVCSTSVLEIFCLYHTAQHEITISNKW